MSYMTYRQNDFVTKKTEEKKVKIPNSHSKKQSAISWPVNVLDSLAGCAFLHAGVAKKEKNLTL